MRNQSEVDSELQKLSTLNNDNKETTFEIVQAVTVQALAWVMGDELSPTQMFKDEIEAEDPKEELAEPVAATA